MSVLMFHLTFKGTAQQSCTLSSPNLIITGTSNYWTTPRSLTTNVELAAGARLEITANVEFVPQAKIIVKPGAALIVRTCTLTTTCWQMWKGIELETGGFVNLSAAVISNASYGVSALNTTGSTALTSLSVTNTLFLNNYIGIDLLGHTNLVFSLKGSTFDCTAPLINTGVLNGGTKTFAGIKVRNTTNLSITNQSINFNTFRGLSNGITATNSNITVRRCSFVNINPDPDYDISYPYNGTAIACDGQENTNFTCDINGFVTNTAIRNIRMESCYRGTVLKNYNGSIVGTTLIGGQIGHECINSNAKTYLTRANYMEVKKFGYKLVNNLVFNCKIQEGNNIDMINSSTNSSGYGIYMTGCHAGVQAMPFSIWIETNRVELFGKGVGMLMSDNSGVRIVTSNVISSSPLVQANYLFNQINNLFVSCNTASNGINLNLGILHRCFSFFNCTRSIVDCNRAINGGTGFSYGGISNFQLFKGNEMTNNKQGGLLLTNTTTGFDAQPANSANLYIGNYSSTNWALNSQANTQFNGNFLGNGEIFYENPSYPVCYPIASTNPTSILDQTFSIPDLTRCLNGTLTNVPWSGNFHYIPACVLAVSGLSNSNVSYNSSPTDQGVINNSIQFDEFNEELKYENKKYLLERMLKDVSLATTNLDFASFYNTYIGENVFKLADIDKKSDEVGEVFDLALTGLQQGSARYSLIAQSMDSIISLYSDYDALMADPIATANINQLYTELNQMINSDETNLQSLSANYHQMLDQIAAENLATIYTSKLIEQNEIIANEIYFGKILKHDYQLSSYELETVMGIANQCPVSGGRGVFKSRIILDALGYDYQYNDNEMCALEGYQYRKAKQKGISPMSAKVNNNEIQLMGDKSLSGVYSFEIIDSKGSECYSGKVLLESGTAVINAILAQGLYLLRINNQVVKFIK